MSMKFDGLVDAVLTLGEGLPTDFLRKASAKGKNLWYMKSLKQGQANAFEKVDRIESNGREKTVILPSGLKVICDESDIISVVETLLTQDYHRIAGYEITGNVFDIGANIGGFTLCALRYGAERVFAFEPEERNFNYIVRNAELNGFSDRVIAKQLGIYSHSGEVRFNFNALNSGGHSVGDQGTHKINVVTLRAAMQGVSVVDCLKIDVEGSEYEIFRVMGAEDFRKIRKIVGEYHCDFRKADWNFLRLYKLLKPHYKVVRHVAPHCFMAY